MAGPNQIPGPTAIRAPTPSVANHQVVLTQLKETTETAQRLRGNPNQSYVTLGELISAGIIKFIGGVVSPGVKASSSGGTVSVLDSITGDGSSGSPLQLDGDSATPGNTKLYGTNGSGVKGWYSQPGGSGSISITDGTTTVTGVTSLAVTGGVVGGTTPNATLTISGGGGSTGPGGVTGNLYYWFQADKLTGSSGSSIIYLPNSLDALSAYSSFVIAAGLSGATLAVADLNGLNTANFGGTGQSRYGMISPTVFSLTLANTTCFYVMKIPSPATAQVLLAGQTGSFQIGTDGTGKMAIVSDLVAVLAVNASNLPTATYFQQNVTWNNSANLYAFRTSQAADGSGSGSGSSVSQPSNFIGWNQPAAVQDLNASVAEFIIFNRVLASTEILAIEAYLFAKWGV